MDLETSWKLENNLAILVQSLALNLIDQAFEQLWKNSTFSLEGFLLGSNAIIRNELSVKLET